MEEEAISVEWSLGVSLLLGYGEARVITGSSWLLLAELWSPRIPFLSHCAERPVPSPETQEPCPLPGGVR